MDTYYTIENRIKKDGKEVTNRFGAYKHSCAAETDMTEEYNDFCEENVDELVEAESNWEDCYVKLKDGTEVTWTVL